ncbi:hypothetical protein [Natrialba sp. INN-245]|uniref:hypothetical protein n=1 Tax=Natrialba sp. INN-245 TaxID=2690967 RepID=UPI0013103A4E|nr:hypothetical protein [Natrialba sp. INN-245]MWV38230.1 hypothetical protein [Natrialba sp. INN-245]
MLPVASVDPVETVFEASDGQYYTAWQVRRRLESGRWRCCLRQRDPDRRLVETECGQLLFLVATDPRALPDWTELRIERTATHVVDTRSSLSQPVERRS